MKEYIHSSKPVVFYVKVKIFTFFSERLQIWTLYQRFLKWISFRLWHKTCPIYQFLSFIIIHSLYLIKSWTWSSILSLTKSAVIVQWRHKIPRHFNLLVNWFESRHFMIIPAWTWLLISLFFDKIQKSLVVLHMFLLFWWFFLFIFLLFLLLNVWSRARSSLFWNITIPFNFCLKRWLKSRIYGLWKGTLLIFVSCRARWLNFFTFFDWMNFFRFSCYTFSLD